MKTKLHLTLFAIAIAASQFAFSQVNFKLDPGFANNGIYRQTRTNSNASVCPFSAVQVDGKILFAGLLIPFDGAMVDTFVVYRLNANGTPDNTFGANGAAYLPVPTGQLFANSVNALSLLPNGKILILGNITLSSNSQGTIMARFNTNGTLDNTFGQNGVVSHNTFPYEGIGNLGLMSNGKIVISGLAYWDTIPHAVISRYNENGLPDTTFDKQYKADKIIEPILSSAIMPMNMLIDNNDNMYMSYYLPNDKFVGGSINILKLKQDGSRDLSFGINGVKFISELENSQAASTIMKLANGKYVFSYTDKDTTFILQYLNNWNPDLDFNSTGLKKIANPPFKQYFAPVSILALENNNMLLSQTRLDSTIDGIDHTSHRMVGIHSDGSLMNTFGNKGEIITNLPNDGSVGYGCVQPDGKLVFGLPEPNTRFSALRYTITQGTGFSESNVNLNINIYPNPSKGNVNLDLSKLQTKNIQIQLINYAGKIVYEGSQSTKNDNELMDLSHLTKGIYIVRMNTEQGIISKKIILE